ncbi:MAG TPA: hypothetical protein VFD82_06990 [Planctomycetota bacterium]|nr:hypothetical protein [Planctomycetota bacterium]
MPHPALRAGATTLYAPDPLLCAAHYVGDEVAQLVFAVPQGVLVLVDASSSLALHVLAVPALTWSALSGICIDGEHEQVVLLDAAGPNLLRIDLADLRAGRARFQATSLPPAWSTVRGIAFDFARDRIVGFDPETGDLLQHAAVDPNPRAGLLRPVPELLAFGFAPTGTGDHDLFVSSGDQRLLTSEWTWNAIGIDVETATLRATVATSSWSPPSPDPSGLTYDNLRDRLIVVDGEVDEMSIYAGSNVFECTRTGSVSRRSTTVSYSREPTDIAFDSSTRTFYISDDDARRIYVVAAGPDGLLHSSDDTRRSFSVNNFTTDPEGLAFDSVTRELWIAGGADNRVYRLRSGNNGIFDGTSPNGDDQLLSVSVSGFGVTDPEGIAVRPSDGGIYVIGAPRTLLLHLNNSGQFVRTITLPSSGLIKPAGLMFAPRASGTGDSLYVADRGVDNDSHPSENDGRLFEYGVPGPTPVNQAPVVNAGPDVTTVLTSAAQLAGTATDDGLPGPLTIQWSRLSGPGTATFTAPTQPVTNVTFSAAGSYTCQLSAFDGELTSTDTVVVTVQQPPAGSNVVERVIATSDDDAEESSTGSVNRGSSDLEMVLDGTETQVVGLRFQNLTIPGGATITSAYVQFTTDEITSTATQLTIAGQASDNAPTFASTASNISSRSRTTATVAWTPVAWATANEAGLNQRTPNLASIVQQIVNRAGWIPGNSMGFVITGSGTRIASAFDRSAAVAAKLIVNYQSTPPVNQPPVVNAGPDVTTAISAAAHLVGSATDDGVPGPLTIQWSRLSGPGTATFTAPTQPVTDVSFSASGTYTLQLSAFDGELTRTDTVVVTVQPVNQAPAVNAGPDVSTVMPSAAHLVGTVTDDGLPGPLTIQWSRLSGPGTATFTAPTQPVTDVTFSAAGTHTCQLSAFDGALTTTDTVVITVQATPPASGVVERAIAIDDDDAEESPTGSVNLGSSDLEMVLDGTATQVVGLRFQNLTIPAGAVITSAYVQFTTDEATSTATQLTIAGQASDNAATFVSTASNISSRPRTTATVAWAPVPWTTANEAGPNQRTPNLASIVQQIVNRPGWSSGNAMVFVITGTGCRIASAHDGSAALAARLTVNHQSGPVNQPPVVNAGPDVTTRITSAAHLAGSATDDGVPGPLTIQWSRLSGPGTATFTTPTQAVTDVTFSAIGTYTLQLSAFDGELTRTDTVVVTVQPVNQAPVVDAGPDVATVLTSAAHLVGTVTDDGLPGPVTIQWSKLTGPGTATFTAPTQAVTDVSFSAIGSYNLQLSASDGEFTRTDTVTVTVQQPVSTVVERAIATSDDDAEESATGTVNRGSSDLEMVLDGSVNQVVGLRFQNLTVPPGAVITSAYVQFTTDEATSTATQLTIAGEASDNAPTFVSTASSISSRPRTTSTVAWAPVPWTSVDEAGPNQRTPDLASIVQQVVNRPGWSSGNAIAFVITGTGCRIASAYDSSPGVAAELAVSYYSASPVNQPPVVNAGPDVATPIASAAHLVGTVTDDGLPGPVTIQWSKLSGPGTATFAAPTQAVTDVSFSAIGSYTCQLSANDGQFTRTDTVTVTVQQPVSTVVERPIATSDDDAEESATGTVNRGSSDLEMVLDGSVNQVVGLRFQNLTVPPGAVITSAYVQFTTDEATSITTQLTIAGQASDNAPTFGSTASNISSRPRTTSTVAWAPVPWTTVGEAGPNQRTPNLASIVQQVVNRPGWSSGNAIVFVITGTGTRTASAYDDNPALAARLIVNYQ